MSFSHNQLWEHSESAQRPEGLGQPILPRGLDRNAESSPLYLQRGLPRNVLPGCPGDAQEVEERDEAWKRRSEAPSRPLQMQPAPPVLDHQVDLKSGQRFHPWFESSRSQLLST